jgi:signal transduction histidine kinase
LLPRHFGPNDLHAIATVASDLVKRNHRLTTSLPELPVWLKGDAGRLEQVLVNLLVNAAKYTDDGRDLSLFVQKKNAEVIIRIRDSGIGIASDVLPCAFNLFMQADHASRRAEAGFGAPKPRAHIPRITCVRRLFYHHQLP